MSRNFIITLIGGIIFLLIFAVVIFSMQPVKQDTTQQAATSPAPKNLKTVDKLSVEDIKVGTSEAEVKSGDTIVVNYVGTLTDGTKFDSSYDRNEPFTTQIGVGQVIKGWDQGLIGMKVGGKRKLTVPADLGYGPQGQGPIPPNATLIFEIELLEIK